MMALVIEAIKNHQEAIFKVQGSSMEPFLKHNLTNVTLIYSDTFKKGDIILFRYQNDFKLHRIIRIDKEHIIARGDNAYLKEKLSKEDIIGIVKSYETKGKIINPNASCLKLRVFLWKCIKPFVLILRRAYAKLRK